MLVSDAVQFSVELVNLQLAALGLFWEIGHSLQASKCQSLGCLCYVCVQIPETLFARNSLAECMRLQCSYYGTCEWIYPLLEIKVVSAVLPLLLESVSIQFFSGVRVVCFSNSVLSKSASVTYIHLSPRPATWQGFRWKLPVVPGEIGWKLCAEIGFEEKDPRWGWGRGKG